MKKPNRTPLAVGDRVAVYGFVHPIGEAAPRDVVRLTGRILKLDSQLVRVMGDGGNTPVIAGIGQCRRLKPRPAKTQEKRERIEIWGLVNPNFSNVITDWNAKDRTELEQVMEAGERVAHLTELLPGEAIVSRDALAEAFGAAFASPKNAHKQMDADLFDALAKHLGLGDLK